ncbi:sciellin isoform X2 [Corythoichthys intestinalis]|uniref:sciellin isoform X2 n=1 Tax=Corythoichthys intestinalis TaxID=161448 RepID=UPI0025A4E08E|nr:sciellin isoform X2 [Corythoichthys intestinalis]
MTSYQSKNIRTSTSSKLKDDSWIRKDEDEYEAVDRDPNFGSSVLSHYRSTDSLSSSVTENTQITRSTSVQALTKRFSGSQDELPGSSYTKSRVSYTQSSPSYRRSDEPDSSTTTTSVSKDGTITETTVTTTSQNLRKSPMTSPTRTATFSERVQSFSKGAEDKLYDIPSIPKDESGDSRASLSSSETMTVTRTINGAEDQLYDTLLPKGISSTQSSSYSTSSVTKRETVTVESTPLPLSSSSSLRSTSRTYTEEIPGGRISSYTVSTNSLPNDDYSSKSGSYYYSPSSSTSKPSYEYSSISSPTEYSSTTYRSTSRSDDILSSPISSTKSVYTSSDRTVHEKDLCTYCHKPFNGEAKMILDDMKISCHAFCFKCEVCNGTLSHLKAGDCMWVYNHMVHCENCFDVTREKWRH